MRAVQPGDLGKYTSDLPLLVILGSDLKNIVWLQRLESAETAGIAVFGGDTNLREAEVKAEKRVRGAAKGKAQGSVLDGWVAAGSDAGSVHVPSAVVFESTALL